MASSLTSAQLKELKDAFNVFDSDHSGKISVRELGNIFKALNVRITDAQLKGVAQQMDTDGSGQIEFEEFARVMAASYFRKYSQEELRKSFQQFDLDNSGYIQANELQNIMQRMGRHVTQDEIDCMIASIDKTGDGRIEFNEFVTLFN